MSDQLDLFEHVLKSYVHEPGSMSNESLYRKIACSAGISSDELNAKQPIGKSGEMHSPLRRQLVCFSFAW